MGTVLEPPGTNKSLKANDKFSKSAQPSKRKYTHNYEIPEESLTTSMRHKTMEENELKNENGLIDNLSKSVKNRRKEPKIEVDSNSSSDDDADKFLAAAQANAKARLSEK